MQMLRTLLHEQSQSADYACRTVTVNLLAVSCDCTVSVQRALPKQAGWMSDTNQQQVSQSRLG